MSLLIMTMVHDFSGEGYSDVYKLSPDKSNVPAVINNNLDNYFKFNPGCNVVMHVNAEYKDFEWEDIPNVLVSPKRFVIKHGQCQLSSILTMFKHAVDSGIDFDYVTINHSGEMYVKPGAYEYMKQFDIGIWHGPLSDVKNQTIAHWPPFQLISQELPKNFDFFDNLFYSGTIQNYCASQLEGSFYKREIFQKIYDWFAARYDIERLNEWPVYMEEIMIPTLAYHLCMGKVGTPVCAFYIEGGHKTLDNWEYVQNVIDGKNVIAWGADNLPFWANRILSTPTSGKDLYTIKRINRIIDDPIRVAITNLSGV